jgi:hypothetical protein
VTRRPADRYLTPPDLARFLVGLLPEIATARQVLEPSCGEGAWLEAWFAERHALLDGGWVFPSAERVGVDIVSHPAVDVVADYLRPHPVIDRAPGRGKQRTWDLILGNPPYSLAAEFVRRSLALTPNGTVAFLLRLAFLESRGRVDLWDRLARVHVLAERPSFTGSTTDRSAYALFVWGPTQGGRRDPAIVSVHSWKTR